MKPAALRFPLFGLIATLAGSGCASTARIAEPVGPDPRVGAYAANDGQLVVYTRVDLVQTAEMPDVDVARHLAYDVLDAEGRRLMEVENHAFPGTGPQTVTLPPGTYIIRAPGLEGHTDVELVARVDAGKTTVVHLDQPVTPPQELAGEGLFSKAPSGWRVGWSAKAGSILGTEAELRYVGSPVVEGFVAEAHGAAHATVSIDERAQHPLDELRLGTADLAGVAGSFSPPADVTCQKVGTDKIVAVVRADSPIKSLERSQFEGLASGGIRRWSSLGEPDAPVVLAVGSGTGAESMVLSSHALHLMADELIRRVSNGKDIIAITSEASVRGAHGVRVVPINGEPTTIPLSLCAAKGSPKAVGFIRWTTSEEARSIAARYFEPAMGAAAIAAGASTHHGG